MGEQARKGPIPTPTHMARSSSSLVRTEGLGAELLGDPELTITNHRKTTTRLTSLDWQSLAPRASPGKT